MTGSGRVPLFANDSAPPDEEREMLDLAGALVPLLADRAPTAAAARQLPAETIADYHAAGILRILQPRRFGGQQGRFSLFSRIVEELTFGCASSAWVYAAEGLVPHFLGLPTLVNSNQAPAVVAGPVLAAHAAMLSHRRKMSVRYMRCT